MKFHVNVDIVIEADTSDEADARVGAALDNLVSSGGELQDWHWRATEAVYEDH